MDELIERAAVRLLIHAGAEAELATQRAEARRYSAEFITSGFFVSTLSPDPTRGPAYYHQPPPDDRLPALDINAFVGRQRVAKHAFDYKVTYYPHSAEPIFREWQASDDLVVNIGNPPELS